MGLQNVIRHIILDVSKHKYVVVPVKQYDVNIREITVTVTDNGKPYVIDNTITPRIQSKKKDGTYIINDCDVLTNGDVHIDVTDQMTIFNGLTDYELVLYDTASQKILHTMNFKLSVKQSVLSNEDIDKITSTNEFNALENALNTFDNLRRITEAEIDALFV